VLLSVLFPMTMKQQKQAGFLLAKIHQLGGRVFARLLREHGVQINPAQGRIMFALWQQDGIAINDLAQRTKLGKSTLTSMLDRLEKAGWLKRVPSKEDRRKILIQRTEKDKVLESLYVRVSQEMAAIWYKGFTEPQIERFETDLQQVLDNLSEFEKHL
jgi:DNA-binding MarR family transcriptional regulator